ncbi:hypothetical protein NQ318_006431 [Aromia moschata]|uniref:Mos1 transposase HTH domain-containing protein n=1 Tax=Aromia moschata TaxID=1265417 RepID=A0AAV8XSV6_9CUCU|nr:hypothetical protein NQ318_006431 [Aromia moschata]
MLEVVYGNECLSRTRVFEWFKRFKEGSETTADDRTSGWNNPQILHGSSNMGKVCEKMVPKLLTPEQKESRMNICGDILNNIDTDPS